MHQRGGDGVGGKSGGDGVGGKSGTGGDDVRVVTAVFLQRALLFNSVSHRKKNSCHLLPEHDIWLLDLKEVS